MNALSKTVAFLLTIVLLYLLPLYHQFERQDQLIQMHAYNTVTKFVDSVRNKGYITPTMYNDFTAELEKNKYVFDIELVHEQKQYVPVYTDPADPSTFQNEYVVTYDNYYTQQILSTLFPDNSLPIDSDERIYHLIAGDYFKVVVKNKGKTNSTVMRDFLTLNDSTTPEIVIPYGGMVHNEDY